MEIELKSVVLFAAGSVFISVLLSLALAHRRWRESGLAWLVTSSVALLLAVASLFARSTLGFEMTTALVVGAVFGGLVSAYFAVLAAQGIPQPWRIFGFIGLIHVLGHAILASLADTAILLMMTSSVVNSFTTAWMTVSVWRIVRPHGRRIAGLIAFPFAAICAGYSMRLGLLSFGPTEAAASGSTIVIVTLMAWAAIILQIGAVALRERQASQRAVEALEKAKEAAKAKERFLLGLSHEIRTPLNGVLGLAELLRIEGMGPLPEAYRPLIGELQKSGLRLNQLLIDLLEIATSERRDVDRVAELIDVTELSARIVEYPPNVERPAEIAISGEWDVDTPRYVLGDPERLRRLMSALIENAMKFACSRVTVSVVQDDGLVLIAVEDDGSGMTTTEAESALLMFDRGAGGGKPESGAGLGLAVASQIARTHGGELKIGASATLGGLSATLVLPAIDREENDILEAA